MHQSDLNNLKINTISSKSENIFDDVFTVPKSRKGFASNNEIMVAPIYFYRIIGLENDKFESKILDLHNKLLELKDHYLKIENGLDKPINTEFTSAISSFWSTINRPSISADEVIQNTINKTNFPRLNNQKFEILKYKLKTVLNLYMKTQQNLNIVKSFYAKLLFWIKRYGINFIQDYDYNNTNPKVLYYGEIQRDEIYFLIFLFLCGCDIVYFHPQEDNKFPNIPDINVYSKRVEYPTKGKISNFLSAERQASLETVAYRASQEIGSILHTDESGLYSPWQLENRKVIASTLRTTYDELLILWNHEARFREGFKVENGLVYIPNIFAKVSGTHSNIEEYWDNLHQLLLNKDYNIILSEIPFSSKRGYYANRSLINIEGKLNKEMVKKLPEYSFGYLKTSLQNTIVDKIEELIQKSNDIFSFAVNNDFRLHIIYTVLNIDKHYLQLLQKFDYPFFVPKIIIFDSTDKMFSEEDLIFLAFFKLFGCDVLILTPTGYNNLEGGLKSEIVDFHKLESIKFDLTLPNLDDKKSNSAIKNTFSTIKEGFSKLFSK